MRGGILDLWESFPKEFIRFQFPQLVERIADVPQGIEPLSIRGKRFQLCLYNAQLSFYGLLFLSGLLDLRVQWRQFFC
ncbi:MAG: hypothetical protein R6W88_07015 [Desulfobacterales bacterium]